MDWPDGRSRAILRRRMIELMSSFCHRSLVAERLLERADAPMRVLHLTGPMEGRVVRLTLVPA